ncbi:MAG: hypothetical protein HXY40_13350 [Chloroflexi bacterium]|nr:hypothetical protein [Chloroflexota bacterium]
MTDHVPNASLEEAQRSVQQDHNAALQLPPLPNYTLSEVCPACSAPTFRLACKVRCGRCGFVWDCSEV